MAEAKKEAEDDQSMEEILQSIKRIITEDGEAEEGSEDDSILELTEIVEEEDAGGTGVLEDIDAALASEAEPAMDDFGDMESEAAFEPEPESEPEPEERFESEPEMAMDDGFGDDFQGPSEHGGGSMLAQPALAAASSALERLRESQHQSERVSVKPISSSAAAFRGGNTVEDLMMEAMRPMLEDWLNQNLPGIVEHLVEKEIKNLVKK